MIHILGLDYYLGILYNDAGLLSKALLMVIILRIQFMFGGLYLSAALSLAFHICDTRLWRLCPQLL